jgi:hypothetical protein
MNLPIGGYGPQQTIALRGCSSGFFIKLFFAVEGMSFEFMDEEHSGEVIILGRPSNKVRKMPEGKFVYKDKLSIMIINGSDGKTTDSASGTGVIDASAIKNKAEGGVFPLREEDKNNIPIVMTGTNRNPPPTTMTYTTQVKIKDPAQNKSKGV